MVKWRGVPRVFTAKFAVLLLAVGLAGMACRPSSSTSPADTNAVNVPAADARPLRVVTIDDSALSEAMSREWQANSQDPVEFDVWTSDQVPESGLDADVVVFPSGLLGQLATTRQIVPWPEESRGARRDSAETSDSLDEYDWNDVFPWLAVANCDGGKSCTVSVLVRRNCYCSTDPTCSPHGS